MNHLLVHINQDMKLGLNTIKDLTMHTNEHQSKGNPTVKPRWTRVTCHLSTNSIAAHVNVSVCSLFTSEST